ncbi:hypothetical protein KO02_17610 [Sphingobacterium sp. ML3W]|uniref:hypothetical protein n=1 Tax=Sphingobacterium sp. ML3W TaxID=1538644 RepID=UPI0004F6AF55|nr:hypothetical protein [Sphingobacterium sp. ML3W]AIM38300.1 hypothetical protein KO02_17610 [Sphingobacterium sp. ML3W]
MKTIVKQKSAIQQVRELSESNMKQVCQYIGMTEELYCTHQLHEYELFLTTMFSGYPVEMLNEVRYSSLMAGYWKNEWNWRNSNDFLPLAKDELEPFMWVTKEGVLESYEPNEWNVGQLFQEYIWMNSCKKLMNCDSFMKGYNVVLKLIRESNKKKHENINTSNT